MLPAGRTLPSCQTYAAHLYRLAAAIPDAWAAEPSDLARWLATLSDRSAGLQKNAATAVRSFYGWARDVGHVESDPAARLPGRKLRHHDGFPRRWRAAVGRYVAESRVGERTLRQRLGYLRRFALDHLDPWGVTPDALLAWVDQHGGSNQNGARQALRSFYVTLHRLGLTDQDVAAAAIPRLLNGHQVQHLTGACKTGRPSSPPPGLGLPPSGSGGPGRLGSRSSNPARPRSRNETSLNGWPRRSGPQRPGNRQTSPPAPSSPGATRRCRREQPGGHAPQRPRADWPATSSTDPHRRPCAGGGQRS